MENSVFRSKSIDRISSPERLDEYVRVANPGMWMALVAIIVLLIGTCVWGIFGKIDTTVPTVIISNDGRVVCYAREDYISYISPGQPVKVKDSVFYIDSVNHHPIKVTDDNDSYVIHLAGFQPGDWIYELKLIADLQDGVYSGDIVTESISPISFLTN